MKSNTINKIYRILLDILINKLEYFTVFKVINFKFTAEKKKKKKMVVLMLGMKALFKIILIFN